MQILFNPNYKETIVEPTFKANKSNFAKSIKNLTTSEIATKLINEEKSKLDKEKVILQKLLMGFSISELAEKFGVSSYKVNLISVKYNAHKIYMQRRNEIILAKLKKGISRKTIEKEMDVSKKTVQDIAEANNIFKEKIKNRDALIIEKIKSGMEVKDVAKELGIHEATVLRTTKKYDFIVRTLKKETKKS